MVFQYTSFTNPLFFFLLKAHITNPSYRNFSFWTNPCSLHRYHSNKLDVFKVWWKRCRYSFLRRILCTCQCTASLQGIGDGVQPLLSFYHGAKEEHIIHALYKKIFLPIYRLCHSAFFRCILICYTTNCIDWSKYFYL